MPGVVLDSFEEAEELGFGARCEDDDSLAPPNGQEVHLEPRQSLEPEVVLYINYSQSTAARRAYKIKVVITNMDFWCRFGSGKNP